MSALPRLLVIMGSGETSPTMVQTHREVFSRVGDAPAVIFDTPHGFQENADDIAARAVDYFAQSVGHRVDVLNFRHTSSTGSVEHETMLSRLRQACWVFAGPGSPSYALRVWKGSPVPDLLAGKLQHGGAVVFASAAALTLGRFSVPVYEIYKVGEDPQWLEGLDLTAMAGLNAAVIPHYNNAEGGGHDTRYCYLGERRLRVLEQQLPDETFVLGVDEHTACVIDLDEGTASVAGLGVVTSRHRGRQRTYAAGAVVGLDELSAGEAAAAESGAPNGGGSPDRGEATAARSPLRSDVSRLESDFDQAIGSRQSSGAVGAILDLDQLLVDWSRDTLQSDDLDNARSALRSLVVRLGEAADAGLRDPREAVAPYVDALVDLRRRLREESRYEMADEIRERLVSLGLEVKDSPEGTEWSLP